MFKPLTLLVQTPASNFKLQIEGYLHHLLEGSVTL